MFFQFIAASLLVCTYGSIGIFDYFTGATLPLVPILNGRIIGGTPAVISEAPYQVALLLDYKNNGEYSQVCGGTIVSENIILTAAHCTDGTTPDKWRIRAGSSYHNIGGKVVDVANITQHDGYTERLDNNIALFFIASDLTLTSEIQIISLPAQGQTVADGSPAFITGWGTLVENGTPPTQLHKVILPIINQQRCIDAYSSFNPVTENMICAGRLGIGGQDACQGDSGGPLVINNVLIGVTSWSLGCAQPDYPGVWVRVPMYRDWIDSNIESGPVFN